MKKVWDKKPKKTHILNNEIVDLYKEKSKSVRVLLDIDTDIVNVSDINGKIKDFNEVLNIANSLDMDVILYNDKTDPIIVKIAEYNKFVYEEKKRKKELEKKNKENNKQEKEITISLNIGENDLAIKNKQIESFIEKKHKVKVTIKLKGRESYIKNSSEKALEVLNSMIPNNAKAEPIVNNNNKIFILKISPKN